MYKNMRFCIILLQAIAYLYHRQNDLASRSGGLSGQTDIQRTCRSAQGPGTSVTDNNWTLMSNSSMNSPKPMTLQTNKVHWWVYGTTAREITGYNNPVYYFYPKSSVSQFNIQIIDYCKLAPHTGHTNSLLSSPSLPQSKQSRVSSPWTSVILFPVLRKPMVLPLESSVS